VAPAADLALVTTDEEEATPQRLKQLRQSSPDVFRKVEKELWDAIQKGWDRVLAADDGERGLETACTEPFDLIPELLTRIIPNRNMGTTDFTD